MGVTTTNATIGSAAEGGAKADPSARRRGELLTAAMQVIRDRGAGASMEEMAAGCGVTKPILYRHFGDRDGLVRAMALDFATGLVVDLARHIRSTAPIEDRIAGAVNAFVTHIEQETALYRFLTQEAPPGAEQFLASLVAEEVAEVLRELLASVDRPDEGATVWAYGLVGAVHFAGDWWAVNQSIDRQELVDQLVTLIWSGLAGLGLDRQENPS